MCTCEYIAGEGRLVGTPKVRFWSKCTKSSQVGCPLLPLFLSVLHSFLGE